MPLPNVLQGPMPKSYECFDCKKLYAIVPDDTEHCPACGGSNGQFLSPDRVKEGMEAGAYYNIDPKTGRRSKKRR